MALLIDACGGLKVSSVSNGDASTQCNRKKIILLQGSREPSKCLSLMRGSLHRFLGGCLRKGVAEEELLSGSFLY